MPTMDTLMNNKAVMLGLSVLAFLVAAMLVITIFRMLVGGRLRMPGGRARQARLGIVDAFDLDRQRQLIIVRRDNTEHLIMIGGPNDIVIESEIVRAEARELREPRREGVPGDVRIPAPATGPLPPPIAEKPTPRPSDEPRLPTAAAPIAPPLAPAPAVARAPTFPLPPRRPVATPERRPLTPPKLPESVSRNEDAGAFAERPAAPAPAPPAPIPPPGMKPPLSTPPAAAPPMPPAAPTAAPAASAASAPTARPPFLKPLPPRPPARPLPRTTLPATPTGAPSSASRPPPITPSMAPSAPPPGQGGQGSSDALESLEEEMAKLLGRGS